MTDVEILRSFLDYDKETGIFTWLERVGENNFNSKHAGKIAGTTKPNGYKSIGITLSDEMGNKNYLSHRLAWLYIYGEWPKTIIDHIDGNRSNNAITNLREISRSENRLNTKYTAPSKSGIKGVHWDSRGGNSRGTSDKHWRAQGIINGRKINFGYYTTVEEAEAAYTAGMLNNTQDDAPPLIIEKTKRKTMVTHEELLKLIHYDPETGIFHRIGKNGMFTDIKMNSKTDYKSFYVKGCGYYKAHLLAWFYMTGEWPKQIIDHIDRNRNNNAFSNLREASRSLNAFNRKSKPTRGIRKSRNTKCWHARITLDRKEYQIGTFDTKEEAKEAWLKFAREHHGQDLNM